MKTGRRHAAHQIALCVGAVLFCGATLLPAADWPQFRANPSLTGVSDEKLPDKPALLWSFKTGGPVKSSPAIVGGTVFIGSQDSNLVALALNGG